MDLANRRGVGSRDLLDLLLLAALWGGSFLLLRLTAPAFGPVFLIEMRVLTGLVVLLPILFYAGKVQELISNWRILALLSLTNMCLPFCLLAFTSLFLGAGTISILNATVPFFAAATGFFLFGQKIKLSAALGLVVGFSGVVVLMAGDTQAAASGTTLIAFAAGLSAAMMYGFSTNIINSRLLGVSGLAITTGCLFFSVLYLFPVVLIWARPDELPGGIMWLYVFILGTACTGLPYIMFYRLIVRIGAYQSLTVTYLVPVFSILYGALLLAEPVTGVMLFGSSLVLLGIAVTTGRLNVPAFLRRTPK
jgi:drug/metabolite transporter (DMT)-like permease